LVNLEEKAQRLKTQKQSTLDAQATREDALAKQTARHEEMKKLLEETKSDATDDKNGAVKDLRDAKEAIEEAKECIEIQTTKIANFKKDQEEAMALLEQELDALGKAKDALESKLTVSFLQVESHAKPQMVIQRVMMLLNKNKHIINANAVQLIESALNAHASDGKFDKIITVIDKQIIQVSNEGSDDSKHCSWCYNEFDLHSDDEHRTSEHLDKTILKIDETEAAKKESEKKSTDATEQIESTRLAMNQKKENITKKEMVHNKNVADLEQMKSEVESAAEFLQREFPTNSVTGGADRLGRVNLELTKLLGKYDEGLAAAQNAHTEAVNTHEKEMDNLEVKDASERAKLKSANSEVARLTKKLESLKKTERTLKDEEFKSGVYLESLVKACGDDKEATKAKCDARDIAREREIAAMKEAITALQKDRSDEPVEPPVEGGR